MYIGRMPVLFRPRIAGAAKHRLALFSGLSLSLSALTALAGDKPWDAAPQRKCSEVITHAGEFTPQTASALTWLVGYMDGLRAVSVLDKRLGTLSEAGSLTVGPMLLAFCQKNQEDTMIGAATSVAELLINAQPGHTLNLEWKH
jgi:hypothetical protein